MFDESFYATSGIQAWIRDILLRKKKVQKMGGFQICNEAFPADEQTGAHVMSVHRNEGAVGGAARAERSMSQIWSQTWSSAVNVRREDGFSRTVAPDQWLLPSHLKSCLCSESPRLNLAEHTLFYTSTIIFRCRAKELTVLLSEDKRMLKRNVRSKRGSLLKPETI